MAYSDTYADTYDTYADAAGTTVAAGVAAGSAAAEGLTATTRPSAVVAAGIGVGHNAAVAPQTGTPVFAGAANGFAMAGDAVIDRRVANTFDGGGIGAEVTLANSGGTSGTAWDIVEVEGFGATPSTLTYDTVHKYAGDRAARSRIQVEGGWVRFGWTAAGGLGGRMSQFCVREYLWVPSTGSGEQVGWTGSDFEIISAGGAFSVAVNGTTLRLRISADGQSTDGAVAVTYDAWVRVEVRYVSSMSATSADGRLEARLFLTPGSTSPDDTLMLTGLRTWSDALFDYTTGVSTFEFLGNPTEDGGTLWFDEMAIDTADWVGPVIPAYAVARPLSTVTPGLWTTEDGGTDLDDSIDEVIPDTADFIQSSVHPASDVCEVLLGPLTDPVSAVGHVVSYQYARTGDGTIDLTVRLVNNTTVIATWTHNNVSTSHLVAEHTLSEAEANAISDYTNLRLRFEALAV